VSQAEQVYIRTRSDGSDGTCGAGEGRDHDDEQEDSESVRDRFDILEEAREVEACHKRDRERDQHTDTYGIHQT